MEDHYDCYNFHEHVNVMPKCPMHGAIEICLIEIIELTGHAHGAFSNNFELMKKWINKFTVISPQPFSVRIDQNLKLPVLYDSID